ncbi:MAG: beta-ketoacyl-ACP synthase III [Alphaproteobacteria bacterium]
MQKDINAVLIGSGAYLPERIMTNDEISQIVDTSDEWIRSRSGIAQRHIAAEGERTSDLATKAAQRAMDDAGVTAKDIDLIVVATATPDHTFPATATKVQANLGIEQGAAFDVQAVCTGFVYAVATANGLLSTGVAKRAIVIGAETFSRILDWEDRTTCVLFGDGAGAIILEAQSKDDSLKKTDQRGVRAAALRADGRHHDLLYVDSGPSSGPNVGFLRMEGNQVFRHAVKNLHGIAKEVLEAADLTTDDIDWVVPHQANRRIIDSTVNKLKLDPERVVYTVEKHGNTSAASIPLAFDEARKDGRLKDGDLVLIEGMGGGFTWGAALIRL